MTELRPEPRWVPSSAILAIHADQIRQHGGRPGIRDEGLLHPALERPRNRWLHDSDADPATPAAALAWGIARGHPFADGNKRTAFLSMYVFLGLNGLRIVATEPEAVELMLDVAAGEMNEAGLAHWLRRHVEER